MLSRNINLAVAFGLVPFASAQLPIVDLGYDLHQASLLNATGGFYDFSNIRYAEPPIGDLRFRAPLPVSGTHNGTVNKGDRGVVCPASSPGWGQIADKFFPDYLNGTIFNLSATVESNKVEAASTPTPPLDGRTSEDCLFLDVVVPQKIFDAKGSAGAPVMVWFHGDYTFGSKSGNNPAGLLHASQDDGSPGVIYVAFNYRLGAFGWLAGPTLQSDGVSNAALYDQLLALQWIQDNINLFGGDPNQVTVIGEASGGGAIMHLITAFGGLAGPVPFQKAILQSPEFQLLPGSLQQEQVYDDFLSRLNVSTLAEVRQLPSDKLIQASKQQVTDSAYSFVTYGPVVDGLITPALPGKLFLQGSYDKNLTVMVGYNAQEGLAFAYPDYDSDHYEDIVSAYFPDLDPSIADYLTNVLYPPVYDGSKPYVDETTRIALTFSEYEFDCNTVFLANAFPGKAYSYVFSIDTALHGADIAYTYYNGPKDTVLNDTTALALQHYLTSFAKTGVPSASGVPHFPLYGNDSEVLNLNLSSITEMKDPSANERCAWWQKGLVY